MKWWKRKQKREISAERKEYLTSYYANREGWPLDPRYASQKRTFLLEVKHRLTKEEFEFVENAITEAAALWYELDETYGVAFRRAQLEVEIAWEQYRKRLEFTTHQKRYMEGEDDPHETPDPMLPIFKQVWLAAQEKLEEAERLMWEKHLW